MQLEKPYLLREEIGGNGLLFHRPTGQTEVIASADLKTTSRRIGVEFKHLDTGTPYPRRARVAPFCVWYEITRACNLECPYCGAPSENGPPSVSFNQVVKILDDLAQSGVFEIRLTGGEPTLHPDFGDIVQKASELGFFISVNTNGVLTHFQADEYASLPIGLHILSIDGTESAHNKLRPPDSYQKVMETLRSLARKGKRVRVNTVLCQENRDCLSELVAELDKLGVEALTIIPLRPAGRAKQNFDRLQLSRQEYALVLDEIQKLREKHHLEIAASYDTMSSGRIFNTPSHFSKRCVAGIEAACIGPAGDLRACILLDDSKYIVGNLLHYSFAKLWANDDLWGIFRSVTRLSQRCQTCTSFATHCPGTCQVMTDYFGSPELDIYCQLE